MIYCIYDDNDVMYNNDRPINQLIMYKMLFKMYDELFVVGQSVSDNIGF